MQLKYRNVYVALKMHYYKSSTSKVRKSELRTPVSLQFWLYFFFFFLC